MDIQIALGQANLDYVERFCLYKQTRKTLTVATNGGPDELFWSVLRVLQWGQEIGFTRGKMAVEPAATFFVISVQGSEDRQEFEANLAIQ